MEKQKEKFPESEIPHILEALVDAVFTMDGKDMNSRNTYPFRFENGRNIQNSCFWTWNELSEG